MDSLLTSFARARGLALGAFTLAALSTASFPARAATIDFTALEITRDPYIEDGFELNPNGYTLLKGFYNGMNICMYPGATIQTNTLRPLAATIFDILKIDLCELNDSVGAQTIEFTGTRLVGGPVSQTFTTDGPLGFQTFTFGPEFSGLTSVTWDQMNPESFLCYDNIILQEGIVSTRATDGSAIKQLYAR
jgi:hypothetical protein